MKQCPRCNHTYSDDQLNFCLEDGELLTAYTSEPPPARYADDPPPTVMMNDARITNPTNWPAASSPPAKWQPPKPHIENQLFGSPGFASSPDQTLPTIALVLGILSLPLFCCWGGLWLGLPAAIVGFIGMNNADKDPGRYGGRGMAIAGMVLGVVSMLLTVLLAFFGLLAS